MLANLYDGVHVPLARLSSSSSSLLGVLGAILRSPAAARPPPLTIDQARHASSARPARSTSRLRRRRALQHADVIVEQNGKSFPLFALDTAAAGNAAATPRHRRRSQPAAHRTADRQSAASPS